VQFVVKQDGVQRGVTDGEFPLCDENGNNYMEITDLNNRRTVLAAFNTSDQLQWSTLFGDIGLSNGFGLDAKGTKLYLVGLGDDGYTYLDYDEGSELDYFQDYQFTGDNEATLSRFDFSLITTVAEISGGASQTITCHPNPSDGLFKISIPESILNGTFYYRIFDSMGRMILNSKKREQTTLLDIDLIEHASGIYLMELNIEGYHYLIKLNKQ